MFICGKTRIDTILKNKELIPEYAKIDEALYDWYVLANSKNIFRMGPQLVEKAKSKLTHNHCEVLCNMIIIIFMLCHCVVDYSDIQ